MPRIRLMDRNRIVLWTDSLPVAASTLRGLARATPLHPYALDCDDRPPITGHDIARLAAVADTHPLGQPPRWRTGYFTDLYHALRRLQAWLLVDVAAQNDEDVLWGVTDLGREVIRRMQPLSEPRPTSD